jgi:hypothetical protein
MTTATRRITRSFRSATPEQLEQGLKWYPSVWEHAQALSTTFDSTPYAAAGVIAALSPRSHWATNLAAAASVLSAVQHSEPVPPRVSFPVFRERAWRIALNRSDNPDSPLQVLSGMKVRSFYSNIIGDHDAVTVDIWAYRVAVPSSSSSSSSSTSPQSGAKLKLTPRQYLEISDAYRRAARILGATPAATQAVTWGVERGSYN